MLDYQPAASMLPSQAELISLCANGNLTKLQTFLEKTLPSLPTDEQVKYCNHPVDPCDEVPCSIKVTNLANAAAEAGQIDVFTYLWEKYLGPRGSRIPWAALRAAARFGSIPIAEAFYARDPNCFNTVESESPRGGPVRNTQIDVAIRQDNYDYVDYLLAHGADMNYQFPERSPVRAAVRSAVDNQTVIRRITFLIERGAFVRGSGALRAAASEGKLDIVRLLLSKGADVDDLGDESHPIHQMRISSLISAAAAGHEEVIMVLLQHGAKFDHVDRSGMSALEAAEKNHHTRAAEVLREYQLRAERAPRIP